MHQHFKIHADSQFNKGGKVCLDCDCGKLISNSTLMNMHKIWSAWKTVETKCGENKVAGALDMNKV